MTPLRVMGVALVAAAYTPVHRLLVPGRAGPAGIATLEAADAAWSVGLYGSLLAVGAGFALSLVAPASALRVGARRATTLLSRPPSGVFAASVALLAAILAASIARGQFGGLPTSVDEMAHLLHARALGSGLLGVPVPGSEAAWTIQNGLVTTAGWVSIYPPLHTLALTVALALGAGWLVGPVAVGVATWAATLSFERLLGSAVGRAAGLLLAVTPFWLLLGGTHLSHTTAAAGLALVLWTGLRARDEGGTGWAVAAGVAVGLAVTSRPWVGLVCSATLLAAIWWPSTNSRAEIVALGRRTAATLAGGLPFAGLLFWWNARLFGHPLELGYAAAFGPAHGLGLHVDPWGNVYGAREALAYTGADLVQLGAHLLESPLPVLVIAGAGLLVLAGDRSARMLVAWCGSAVAANALYWHHGVHFGPRMLYESTPAWVALTVLGGAALTGPRVPERLRSVASWTLVVAALGAAVLAPGVVRAAAIGAEGRALATIPRPAEAGALVFVHGSWSSRIAARLAATGMRRDSIETVLRRNDICDVDRFTRAREGASGGDAGGMAPSLDLVSLPGSPSRLRPLELSPGNVVRMDPERPPDARCATEAGSDRLGTLELEPLIWQAPPTPGQSFVLARDLGPAANRALLTSTGRPGYLLVLRAGATSPELLDYDEGMRLLWAR